MWRRTLPILCGLALAALGAAPAMAAEEYATVRTVQGNALVQGTQDTQPQAVTINTPLMPGDNLWTDSSGQADILLRDGNHLYLDYDTRVEFDSLPSGDSETGQGLAMRLWKGSVLLDVRAFASGGPQGYVVTTPSASVAPQGMGLFYLDVESVDRTKVASLEGSCLVASSGETVTLGGRQMSYAEYGYPPTTPAGASVDAASLMAFRDKTLPKRAPSVSDRYLPSNLDAYASDLDANGEWVDTSDYGYVWRPIYVSADWAPYTYGRWCYNPWGMTWVPYEPWGWAPFHYGRWVFSVGFGWGWCPMPYFAPAWCSFWWGDGGWLGWCPLGYYGSPLWGPAGWYSCNVANIYNANVGPYITHHHKAPPPKPIYPTAQGSPAVLAGGGPRGAIRPYSINLPPSRVQAFREGRVGAREIAAQLTEPVAAPRRPYPAVQPLDRPFRGEPATTQGAPRTARPTGRVEPGAAPITREPGTGRTQPGTWERRPPVQPPVRTGPTGRQAPGQWSGQRTAPPRQESPPRVTPREYSPAQPNYERPREYSPPREPRYIPSRPSAGVPRTEAPRYSAPAPAPSVAPSSGGHKRR